MSRRWNDSKLAAAWAETGLCSKRHLPKRIRRPLARFERNWSQAHRKFWTEHEEWIAQQLPWNQKDGEL